MNTDDDQVTRGGQASQAGYDGHDTLGVEEPSLFAVLPPSYEESVTTGTPGTSGQRVPLLTTQPFTTSYHQAYSGSSKKCGAPQRPPPPYAPSPKPWEAAEEIDGTRRIQFVEQGPPQVVAPQPREYDTTVANQCAKLEVILERKYCSRILIILSVAFAILAITCALFDGGAAVFFVFLTMFTIVVTLWSSWLRRKKEKRDAEAERTRRLNAVHISEVPRV